MILLDICTECTWQIIPMLLGAWLLGWLFWWLFTRSGYQTTISGLEKDRDMWHEKATALEKDLSSARYEQEKSAAALSALRGKYGDMEVRLLACEEEKSAALKASAAIVPPAGKSTADPGARSGITYRNDDLKVVDGIGPKIESLLKEAGINNWTKLAEAKPERLQEILNAAGESYKLSDPGSWPHQAALASKGKWNELKDYQESLK